MSKETRRLKSFCEDLVELQALFRSAISTANSLVSRCDVPESYASRFEKMKEHLLDANIGVAVMRDQAKEELKKAKRREEDGE